MQIPIIGILQLKYFLPASKPACVPALPVACTTCEKLYLLFSFIISFKHSTYPRAPIELDPPPGIK